MTAPSTHPPTITSCMKPSRLLLLLALLAAALTMSAASASAQQITYTAGPFHVGGFQTKLPKVRVRAPQMDGYITRMNATLHYADGRRVSIRKVMLHHIVFLNDGSPGNEPPGSCAGRQGQGFYGTGEEREQLRLPKGYGYRVRATDRWRMQTMLMSHNLRAEKVYVHYTFTFVKKQLMPVRPFWIRANGCESVQPSYTVDGGGKPGSTSERGWTWKVPMTGRIVAVGGHLHGGAQRMTLSQPDCGDRELLDTDPVYAPKNDLVYTIRPILHEPGPVSTRYFLSKRGIDVRQGEKLVLHGLYDGGYPRARVMSIMHVYVAYGRGAKKQCSPIPGDKKQFNARPDGHLRT